MARAIDSEAAYQFLTDQLVKETGAFSRGVNKGLNIARSAMRNPDAMPTLTPPTEPLTLAELQEMDGPVWVACKPIEGGNGYWCLCKHGHIITPAGNIFDVKEIQHWVFYRRPPEGEEDT